MKIQAKKLVVLSLAVLLLGANIKAMADVAAESRRFSVLSVSGSEAYVTKGNTREISASAGMPLGQGSKARTGAQTALYFETDDDKTIKMDSNTQVEITKSSSKKLKLTLKSGEMFFNVDKPLADGEEMNIDAAQTSMSIRGTSGVLSLEKDGIVFYLIEGHVDWNIGNQIVSLQAGEMARLVVGTDETLVSNSMDSIYRLQTVKEFDWTDMDALGLETVLEQRDKLDLSAIGLTSEEDLAQAAERAAVLREEKEAAEEKQKSEEQEHNQSSGGSGGSSVRIDGKEPAVGKEDDDDDRDLEWDLDDGTTDETDPTPDESDPAPDESDPVPDESDPAPDESDPAPDESDPMPDESDPAPDESDPAPDESDPAPDESDPAPDESDPAPDESDPAPDESDPAPDESDPAPDESDPAPDESDPVPDESDPDTSGSETTPAGTWGDNGEWIPYESGSESTPAGTWGDNGEWIPYGDDSGTEALTPTP